MIKAFIFICNFTIILNFNSFSQKENYISKFYNLLIDKEAKKETSQNSNLLSLYQAYISSQDHDKCPYHPSCSEYTFNAIKKEGILKGLIMGSDRLSRCNRHQEHLYILNNYGLNYL